MVKSCCAIGCTNRFKKGEIKFFRLPADAERRLLWITAIQRKDWQPSKHTYICEEHFQKRKPSMDKNHPDYVPSVFTFKVKKNAESYENRIKRIEARREKYEAALTLLSPNSSVFNSGKAAQLHDVNHPDWAPSKNMGYHKTVSQICMEQKAVKLHLEESDVTFVAELDHLKTTTAPLDHNHLKNNAVDSISSPNSNKLLTLPPPDCGLKFDANDAVFGNFGERNNKSSDNEMSPAIKKGGRKRKEEMRETPSHVVNDTTKESHLNENLVTSSDENLFIQNSSEINISQAQTSIETNDVQSVSSNDAQNNSAGKARKHSQKNHGGSSASMYEKPLKIRKRDELFGKLVSIEISDLYDNSELYVKTKQAILNVLVQAHYEQMKLNDRIS